MAANDELPRGVTLNASNLANQTIVLTFPATPGITWVLTEMDATLIAFSASGPLTTILEAETTARTVAAVVLGSSENTNGSNAAGSWTGSVAGLPGGALTVTLMPVVENGWTMAVNATAYPI